jgi:hypothetical protein
MSDKTPTPLERLEAWLTGRTGRRIAAMCLGGIAIEYEVRLMDKSKAHYGYAPTLDAAILAALAQAERMER